MNIENMTALNNQKLAFCNHIRSIIRNYCPDMNTYQALTLGDELERLFNEFQSLITLQQLVIKLEGVQKSKEQL